MTLDDVNTIVVGCGPGTFTGLRIGIATARGLGMALGIPVLGVSTLDALLQGDGVEVACIDARRGEVFAAGAGIEPQALLPQALAGLLARGSCARRRRRGAAPRGVSRRGDRARRLPAARSLGAPSRRADRLGGRGRAACICGCRMPSAISRPPRRGGQRHDDSGRVPAARSQPTWTGSRQIEQRAYPTPWSRSMFAGELAKPGGFCVGAFQGEEMLGYVIVAKYVDAWHIMNIAVDAPFRGRGSRGRCSSTCSPPPRTTPTAGTPSRSGSRTRRQSTSTSSSDSSVPAFVAATTRTTVRTP